MRCDISSWSAGIANQFIAMGKGYGGGGGGGNGRDKNHQGQQRLRSAKAARKAHASGDGWGKKCSENWKIYMIIGIFFSGGFSFVWMIISNLFPAYSYLSIDIDGGAAMQVCAIRVNAYFICPCLISLPLFCD